MTTGVPNLWVAGILAREGRFGRAIRQYQLALSGLPELPEAWLGLGVALLHDGRDALQVREALERAVVRPGETDRDTLSMAEYALGVLDWEQGLFESALAHFERAERYPPGASPRFEARRARHSRCTHE